MNTVVCVLGDPIESVANDFLGLLSELKKPDKHPVRIASLVAGFTSHSHFLQYSKTTRQTDRRDKITRKHILA